MGFNKSVNKPACVLSHFSCVLLFVTLWTVACQAPLLGDSPGKNTGVGCHALLQGIFLTQGLNLRLLSPALAGWFFTSSTTGNLFINKWYSKGKYTRHNQ